MRQEFLPHFFCLLFVQAYGPGNDELCQHPHPHPHPHPLQHQHWRLHQHWHRQHHHRCLYLYRYRVCRKSGVRVRLCPDFYPNLAMSGDCIRLSVLLYCSGQLLCMVSWPGREGDSGLGYSEKGFDWLLDWAGSGSNFPVIEIATRIFCPYIARTFFCPGARITIANIQVGASRTASLYRPWPLAQSR